MMGKNIPAVHYSKRLFGKENSCFMSMNEKSELIFANRISKAGIITVYFIGFWILLPAFLLLVGYRFEIIFPNLISNSDSSLNAGIILSLIGAVILFLAVSQLFVYGRGMPISHLPPEFLVTKGIYKYMRHPVYVGYNLLFAGLCIMNSLTNTAIFSGMLLLILWIIYAKYIEEPLLIKRYGAEYRVYKNNVPLIPPLFLRKILSHAGIKIAERINPLINKLANKTILFRIGEALFVTYGLFITLGSLLFMIHTGALLIEQGYPYRDVAALITGTAVCAIIFGRLFWYMGNFKKVKNEPLFGIRKVGYVSFGDFTGIILFLIYYSFVHKMNILLLADAFIAGMFIAYGIGRIGCLTYGCCYGSECEFRGVMYTDSHSKVVREKGKQKHSRYPIQLFSGLHGIALFIIANILLTIKLPAGTCTALTLLLYAPGRFAEEFYRDRKRIIGNLLTPGHVGSIGIFALGVILLFIIPLNNYRLYNNLFTIDFYSNVITLYPTFILAAFIIFLASAFHWKEVGNW